MDSLCPRYTHMKFEYFTLLFALGIFSLGCTRNVAEPEKTQDDSSSPYDAVEAQAYVFEKPFRIFAAEEAIDTDVGHAAPLVADFDSDGLNDLLVGQFGDGILKIYRNTGSNSQPQYATGVEFMDGSDGDGRVPTA